MLDSNFGEECASSGDDIFFFIILYLSLSLAATAAARKVRHLVRESPVPSVAVSFSVPRPAPIPGVGEPLLIYLRGVN